MYKYDVCDISTFIFEVLHEWNTYQQQLAISANAQQQDQFTSTHSQTTDQSTQQQKNSATAVTKTITITATKLHKGYIEQQLYLRSGNKTRSSLNQNWQMTFERDDKFLNDKVLINQCHLSAGNL